MTDTILGLTCISEELKQKDKKAYSFQKMTRKRFNDLCVNIGRDETIKQLCDKYLHNLIVTQHILNHCSLSDIRHYRLSSNLFPLITDETLSLSFDILPNKKELEEELRFIGVIAFTNKISIGSHPDQFNVLASLKEVAVQKTIDELNFQSFIFDKIGLPQSHESPMNLHINTNPCKVDSIKVSLDVDSNKINNDLISKVADRFYKNLMSCDVGVQNRLTIENEDKGFWNVDNVLLFSDYIFSKYEFNLPVCYDNLHDLCNPSEVENIRWQAERCAYTWVNNGEGDSSFMSPVFHWSEGRNDGTPNPRAHGDYFSYKNLPPIIAINANQEAKWECEVKAKDLAIKKLISESN